MKSNNRLIGLDEPLAWSKALEGLPHGYWHGWQANQALYLGTGQPAYLFVHDDAASGGRAVCAFAERRWLDTVDIFTPGGFTGFASRGHCPGLHADWHALAAERGYVCGYFALHPVLAAQYARTTATNDLYLLDLRIGEAALLEQADLNVRRAIRDWRQSGRPYVTDKQRLTAFILEHYATFMQTMQANQAAVWGTETLSAMCADPAVLMAGVADESGICAVYTFAVTPYDAECHLNISVRDGRRYTRALLWWGIRTLTGLNIPWLHLGGGVVRNDAIAQAKQRFRPICLPLLTAREIYRPDEFERLCRNAGRDPLSAAGFFPPYRTPGHKDQSPAQSAD
ncbi:MAG: hypothetical protein PHW13_05330 [Methylococcales bacterium]|nr:hypothetical protein [Methylococcales bacterium]